MAKVSTKLYAGENAGKFFATEGLTVKTVNEEFSANLGAGPVKLTAKAREISFGGNLAVASAAFGSTSNLLAELESSVNDWLMIQAKNVAKQAVKSFETSVADMFNAAVARFTETRGSAPTDEQSKVIAERCRARVIELQKMQEETVDVDGI